MKEPTITASGKKIFEGDFWFLHRPTAKYKGAFPVGFEKRILKYYGRGLIVNLCCGISKAGQVRIDITREVRPTIIADAQYVPLKDNIADLVLVDPPYNKDWAKMYNCKMPSIKKILNEAARITKPGKFIASLNVYPQSKPKGTKTEVDIAISIGPSHLLRILNIFWKEPSHKLEEYEAYVL